MPSHEPPFCFDILNAQEAVLQWLSSGDFSGAQRALAAWPQQQDSLSDWLAGVLKQPHLAADANNLPAAMQHCLQGWQLYYAGDYRPAVAQFAQSLRALNSQDIRQQVDASLGLGKVYTRSGHWASARSWILSALQLARRGNRQFDLVRGYGALGELFLRAGHPQPALFCLNTAYKLMPIGAAERARQWNYLASVLMRLPEPRDQQAAENMLMQSFYLAQDHNDAESAVHALARLQFLELERGGKRDITQALVANLLDSCQQQVPRGFLAMGRAFAAERNQDLALAQQQVNTALSCFGKGQSEFLWASQLAHCLQSQDQPAAAFNPEIELLAAPPQISVLDSAWQLPQLADEPARFNPPSTGIHALLNHRKVFFL